MRDHTQPEDEPESDGQQSLPQPLESPETLRELIRAVEADKAVSLPPNVMHAMVEMQKNLARMLTPYLELQKYAAASMAPAIQQMADALKAAPMIPPGTARLTADFAAAYKPIIEATEALRRQMATSQWQQSLVALQRAMAVLPPPPHTWCPRNWSASSWSNADIKAATAILCDEGIPLAWVPRAAIVAELIHASNAASRQTILVARLPEIIEDCREVLEFILDPDLKPLVELAASALVALGTAPPAAQALAANIFETFLRDANRRGRMFGRNLGYFKTDKVIKQIAAVSDNTPVNEFREACVLTPALLALQSYKPETDPLPTTFGRHSTVHRAHPQHYTTANAVISVMLAVSFLRQAQQSGW